jgi:hypothetical protein
MKEIKDLGAIQDNRFSGNSTNTKELYIVVTDEPGVMKVAKSTKTLTPTKETIYLAVRADETNATVKMSGYNVTHNSELIAQLKNAKTYNDAIDIAKNENLEFQVLTFPWQRIIRIKQLKYTLTK